MSLHDAVKQLAFEVCVSLIESGADVNAVDDDNKTPLHHAVEIGVSRNVSQELEYPWHPITKLLLAKGANVDAKFKDGRTSLHLAAMRGSLSLVETLLVNGAAVDLACGLGSTALTIAIDRGYTKIVGTLVNRGADVNAVCNDVTPLHRAVMMSKGLAEVTNILLRHGADVNQAVNGKTALHLACEGGHVELMKTLLKAGAKVNVADNNGVTPLQILVGFENPGDYHGAFALLLDHGADPNFNPNNGQPLLHKLVDKMILRKEKSFGPLLQFFINAGVCCNATDTGGLTLLHKCAGFHDWYDEEVEILLSNDADIDAQNDNGETALHLATRRMFHKIVEVLLENHADLLLENSVGETALHVLEACENLPSNKALESVFDNHLMKMRVADLIPSSYEYRVTADIRERHLKAVRDLAKMEGRILHDNYTLRCFLSGKPTRISDALIIEALKEVDVYNYPEYKWILRSIIKKYARRVGVTFEFPWNAVLNGIPPLFRALLTNQDRSELLRLLREKGTGCCAVFYKGKTVLHLATEKAQIEVMDIFIKHGAPVNAADASGRTPLTVLVDRIKSKKYFSNVEKNALQLLLDGGAKTNAIDSSGETPLHALASFQEDISSELQRSALLYGSPSHPDLLVAMQMLLDSRAEIDKRNYAGETALHLACASLCVQRIHLLLNNGADISLKNGQGRTPLDIVRSDPSCRAFFAFEDDYPAWKVRWKSCRDRYFCSELNGNQKARVLVEHMMKLMAVGILPRRVMKYREEDAPSHWFPRRSRSSPTELTSFSHDIEMEVNRLRNHRLCCHLTLFDLLFKENEPSYAEFEMLKQALESINFKTFRLFGSLLENIVKNYRRKHAFKVSSGCLGTLIKTSNALNFYQLPVLPVELNYKICSYLSVSDLKALVSCVDLLWNQIMTR